MLELSRLPDRLVNRCCPPPIKPSPAVLDPQRVEHQPTRRQQLSRMSCLEEISQFWATHGQFKLRRPRFARLSETTRLTALSSSCANKVSTRWRRLRRSPETAKIAGDCEDRRRVIHVLALRTGSCWQRSRADRSVGDLKENLETLKPPPPPPPPSTPLTPESSHQPASSLAPEDACCCAQPPPWRRQGGPWRAWTCVQERQGPPPPHGLHQG
mmetsp:Transcript_8015/g.15903  ORF Transcript_8015/g.15903 Transcript_8015/m.15903 type:complete len:213 (+) Transcript_8015:1365-2003(+)